MLQRISAAAVVVAAVATSLAVSVGTGTSPRRLVSFLAEHGGAAHACTALWLIGAPVVLVAAWWARRRTPWVWVGSTALHLLVLTVIVARFPHVVPPWAWPVLAAVAVAGLASVVTAFPAPDGRRES